MMPRILMRHYPDTLLNATGFIKGYLLVTVSEGKNLTMDECRDLLEILNRAQAAEEANRAASELED